MKRLFISCPQHDKSTEYLYAWSKKAIKFAKERGWKVDVSEGHNVTKSEVQSRLKKKPADFVFFNGHGNESEMCGQNYEVILNETSAHLLKDSITFTRACNCGEIEFSKKLKLR